MEKFNRASDIPDFPGCKDADEHKKLVREYVNAGAIEKSKLVKWAWYVGGCRNTSIAQWTGKCFQYIRNKFGSCYIEKINHFEDDDGYDLFIPIHEVDVE